MKCPQCDAEVADDAAICPKCDHILDPSLFSSEPPPDGEPPPPKPKPKSASGGPRKTGSRPSGTMPAVKKPGTKPPPRRSMPEAPPRKLKEDPVPVAPEDDWRAEARKVGKSAPVAKPKSEYVDPEDFMTEVKHFLIELSLSDRITFWSSLGVVLSCFMPWKETAISGDELGLMTLGAPVFAVAIAMIVALVIRVRKAMPNLHAVIPWLVQFGAGCFCIVWSLVYVRLAWDSTMARSPVGNFEMRASTPSFGVFLAMVAAAAALGGTLMGLREKPA